MCSGVEGLVVNIPTRLLALSTYNVSVSTVRSPDKVAVPVILILPVPIRSALSKSISVPPVVLPLAKTSAKVSTVPTWVST